MSPAQTAKTIAAQVTATSNPRQSRWANKRPSGAIRGVLMSRPMTSLLGGRRPHEPGATEKDSVRRSWMGPPNPGAREVAAVTSWSEQAYPASRCREGACPARWMQIRPKGSTPSAHHGSPRTQVRYCPPRRTEGNCVALVGERCHFLGCVPNQADGVLGSLCLEGNNRKKPHYYYY